MISDTLFNKLKHPYIKVNGTIQIYNEGPRKEDEYITGFVKDKLELKRVEDKSVHCNNFTIHNLVDKTMQVMPDYSYGFKCFLKNFETIKEYVYYLALCDEIKTTLLNI